jgi:hypothetical protein
MKFKSMDDVPKTLDGIKAVLVENQDPLTPEFAYACFWNLMRETMTDCGYVLNIKTRLYEKLVQL